MGGGEGRGSSGEDRCCLKSGRQRCGLLLHSVLQLANHGLPPFFLLSSLPHLIRIHGAIPRLPVVAQVVKAAGIEARGVLLAGPAELGRVGGGRGFSCCGLSGGVPGGGQPPRDRSTWGPYSWV